MRVSKVLLACVIGLGFSATASAEIYQSKDAQGNTVYSDMPSQGAAAVKVPPTNSADPVAVTPRPPPSPETPETAARPRKAAATPSSSEHEETDHDDLYYGDHNYDNAVDDQTKREKRRDDGEAKPKRDRPVATPQRNVSRPAGGGGGARR